jgi:hypothetical protein
VLGGERADAAKVVRLRGRRRQRQRGGGSATARTNSSKPAGSVTSSQRARSEATSNVWGTSREA